MLMFDRITHISEEGGEYGKGQIVAELDVQARSLVLLLPLPGDPVMPGCLGLDALWQMLGFFLGWLGRPARAGPWASARSSSPAWSSRPSGRSNMSSILKRVILRKLNLGIADGLLKADGETIYTGVGSACRLCLNAPAPGLKGGIG